MDVYQSHIVIFKTYFNTIIYKSISVFGEKESYQFYTKSSVNDSDVIDSQFTTIEELRKSIGSTVVNCLEYSESKVVRKAKYIDYITIHTKHERFKAVTVAIYKFSLLEKIKDLLTPLYEENVVFYHNELAKEINAKVFAYEIDK